MRGRGEYQGTRALSTENEVVETETRSTTALEGIPRGRTTGIERYDATHVGARVGLVHVPSCLASHTILILSSSTSSNSLYARFCQ